MYTSIPAITGKQLLGLLQKDGWVIGRKARHGMTLPVGTLRAILSAKQTGLGKNGLLKLLNKYGI